MSDDNVVLTVAQPDKGKSLKLPEPAGPAPMVNQERASIINVEDTSPESGYVTEPLLDRPYVVQAGSALTIGGGQGPGVTPGFVQGRSAGRFIPDFAADADNDSVPEATKATAKLVEDSLDKQGLTR